MEKEKVANRIYNLRKSKNLKQSELAKELGVSDKAISKWESGAIPDINNIINISEFFDCSLDYLLLNREVEEKSIEKEKRTQEIISNQIFILQEDKKKRKRL